MTREPDEVLEEYRALVRAHRGKLERARAAYRRDPAKLAHVRWLGTAEADLETVLEALEKAEAGVARRERPVDGLLHGRTPTLAGAVGARLLHDQSTADEGAAGAKRRTDEEC